MLPIALALFASTAGVGAPRQETAAGPSPTCDIGPVRKRIGGADWDVYGCDDGASMVFRAADGNPASSFSFMVTRAEAGYTVEGRGGNGAPEAFEALDDATSDAARPANEAEKDAPRVGPAAEDVKAAAGNALMQMTDDELADIFNATRAAPARTPSRR